MDTNQILDQLRAERDRLNQAISVLESLDGSGRTIPRSRRAAQSGGKPRRISAAGRARIAAAAKAMWARRKQRAAAAANQAKGGKTVSHRRLSAATRKRLSELAKKRWAKQKKAAKPA